MWMTVDGTRGVISQVEIYRLLVVICFREPPLGVWSFLEINIFVGKMGEINKWPQGMVEIQPILR